MALTKAAVQAAFGAARSTVGSTIAVASDTQSCVGIQGPPTGTADATAFGENGTDTNSVRVSLAEFAVQPKGGTITVDGSEVFVLESRQDEYKATMLISYQNHRPIDDEDLV